MVNTIAGMSSCAIMLCVKKMGETKSRTGGTKAGVPRTSRVSSTESRNVTSRPNAAMVNMATRVIGIE